MSANARANYPTRKPEGPRVQLPAILDLDNDHRFRPEMPPSRTDLLPGHNAQVSIWDRRWVILLGGVLLAGGLCAAYHNTFAVPFLLDDADSISKNATIHNFFAAFFPPANSGVTVSGRPLLNLSLAVNYAIGGTDLFGYHAGNLLIHFAAALCLFGAVRRTLKLPLLADKFGAHATLLAWFVSAIWALHPLQTESVTYIIQRAESLVGLCYLFTLYAFIRAVEKPSFWWTATTVVACMLGMTAKEVMASAPIVFFLYDRTFVSGTFREAWKRHHKLHLALAATWLLLLACVISSGGRGTSVGFTHVSWLDYLLTQGPGIAKYLQHSVIPVGLVFDYGAVIEKQPVVLFGGLAVVTGLFIATCILIRKRPMAGFLGAWFFLILAPTSSIIPVATQTLADHRMYLPLAAVVVAISLAIYRLFGDRSWFVLPLTTGLLCVTTISRNTVFQTSISIWEDTIFKIPDNIRALNNLGAFYLDDERFDEAVTLFSNALQLVPHYPLAHCNLGRALIGRAAKEAGLNNLTNDLVEGVDFGQNHQKASTILTEPDVIRGLELLEKATRIDPHNSTYPAQYGNALLVLHQPDAAIAQLERAVALDPENPAIQFDLANTLSRLDRNQKAAEHFEIALRLNPDDAAVLTNFGSLLRRMNQLPKSIENLQKACRLKPDMARAHSNLGVALLESGRLEEGMRELEESLRLDPNLPQARYNLSNALADAGRTDEAIIHLEALLKIAPPTAELLSNLGVLYARVDRFEDAVKQMRLALQLDPNHEAAQENLSKITSYLQSHAGR